MSIEEGYVTKIGNGVYFRQRLKTDFHLDNLLLTHLNTYPHGCSVNEYFPIDPLIPVSYGWDRIQGPNCRLGKSGNRWSYMEDIVGRNACDLYFKPCYHEKYIALELRSAVMPALRIPAQELAPNGGTCLIHPNKPPAVLDALRSGLPFPDAQTIDDLAASAERRFLDYINYQSSIINVIIELIELCEGNVEVLEKCQKWFRKMAALYWRKFKECLAKGMSHPHSLYIAWRFAIKPSISDIENTVCVLAAAKKRIAFLRKHNHGDVDIKFRKLNCYSPPMYSDFEWPLGVHVIGIYSERAYNPKLPDEPLWGTVAAPESDMRLQFELRDYNCDFSACDMVHLDIPDYLLEDSASAIGTMICALQGLYDPAGIVWEAIPFSWLIDYFRSERSKLEQFKQTYCIIPTTLDPEDPNYLSGINPFPLAKPQGLGGYSFHVTSRWDVYARDYVMDTKDYLGDCAYDVYIRRPGLPQVETSGFRYLLRPFSTLSQASMIGAVWLQGHTRR